MQQGGRQRLRYSADGRTFVESRGGESRTIQLIGDMPVGAWKAPSFPRARTGEKQLSWTTANSVTEFKAPDAEHPLGLLMPAPTDPTSRSPYRVNESPGRRLSLAPPPIRGDSDRDLEFGAHAWSAQPADDKPGAQVALPQRTASTGTEVSCPPSLHSWDMLEEEDIVMRTASGSHAASMLDDPQPPGVVQDLQPNEEHRVLHSPAVGGQKRANFPDAFSELPGPGDPLARASPTAATAETLPGGPPSISDHRHLLLQARSMRSFKRAQKSLGPRDWRKQRDQVELWMQRWNLFTAICGLCGVVAACLQHELVIRGWDPLSFEVNVLKIVNSCASFVLLGEAVSGRLLLYKVRYTHRCLRVRQIRSSVSCAG